MTSGAVAIKTHIFTCLCMHTLIYLATYVICDTIICLKHFEKHEWVNISVRSLLKLYFCVEEIADPCLYGKTMLDTTCACDENGNISVCQVLEWVLQIQIIIHLKI